MLQNSTLLEIIVYLWQNCCTVWVPICRIDMNIEIWINVLALCPVGGPPPSLGTTGLTNLPPQDVWHVWYDYGYQKNVQFNIIYLYSVWLSALFFFFFRSMSSTAQTRSGLRRQDWLVLYYSVLYWLYGTTLLIKYAIIIRVSTCRSSQNSSKRRA